MSPKLVLFLLVPCVVLAQGDAPVGSREWGAVSGRFQLSITAERSQYAVGDPIRITAVLKNVSGQPALLWRVAATRYYQMDVRLPAPDWLPFRTQARLTPLGREETAPREVSFMGGEVPEGYEWKEEIELSKLFDMSAVGEYRITFVCRQPGAGADYGDRKDSRVVIVSNTLRVSVAPK